MQPTRVNGRTPAAGTASPLTSAIGVGFGTICTAFVGDEPVG